MNNKFLILFTLILLVSPILVNADSDLIYPQSSIIDLKIACVFEDVAYCDNQASCNITINYPNGTNLINNDVMTYNEAYFNYTLAESQTNVLGVYPTSLICEDKGAVGYTSFTFKITPEGFESTESRSLIFSILAIIFFFFSVGLIILGLTSQKATLTIFGVFLGIIFLIVTYNVLLINPDLIGTKLHNALVSTYVAFIWIAVFVIFLIILYMIYQLVQWNKYNKKSHMRKWDLLMEDET